MKLSHVPFRSLLRNSFLFGLGLVVASSGCVTPVLMAAFTSAASDSDPLTIEFTDASTAGSTPITDWAWDFGDGEPWSPLHTLVDTVHVYPSEDVTALAQPIQPVVVVTTDNIGKSPKAQCPPVW